MKKDKPSIDDIAIEAEKLGISYGRYVALRDGLIKVENISQNKKAADNRLKGGSDGRGEKQ